MKRLSITQKYALCALYKEGAKATYPNNTNAGCMIMAAFLELFLLDSITFDKEKRVQLRTPAKVDSDYLFLIWRELSNSKPTTLKKWMEYYLYTFSAKKIRRIINAVMDSLVAEHCLIPEVKKGIFHDKITYTADRKVVENVIDDLRTELFRARQISEETVALVVLLMEGDLFRHYFSKEEERELHQLLKEMEHSEIGARVSVVQQVLDELDAMIAMTVINTTLMNS